MIKHNQENIEEIKQELRLKNNIVMYALYFSDMVIFGFLYFLFFGTGENSLLKNGTQELIVGSVIAGVSLSTIFSHIFMKNMLNKTVILKELTKNGNEYIIKYISLSEEDVNTISVKKEDLEISKQQALFLLIKNQESYKQELGSHYNPNTKEKSIFLGRKNAENVKNFLEKN